jgi:hypothetical protein
VSFVKRMDYYGFLHSATEIEVVPVLQLIQECRSRHDSIFHHLTSTRVFLVGFVIEKRKEKWG